MKHGLDVFLGQILGNQRNVQIGTDRVIGSLIFKTYFVDVNENM